MDVLIGHGKQTAVCANERHRPIIGSEENPYFIFRLLHVMGLNEIKRNLILKLCILII